MSESAIKLVLFAALAFSFPCFYIFFVVAGIMPLSLLIYSVILQPSSIFFMLLLIIPYGVLFYWVSARVAHTVACKSKTTQQKHLVVGAIVCCAFFITFLPIYGGGHSSLNLHNYWFSIELLKKPWLAYEAN